MVKVRKATKEKLVAYAKRFLKVTTRPDEPIAVSVEQIAEFAHQLRRGCHQDIIRLLLKLADEPHHKDDKKYLLSLADTLENGGDIELWGLPDCSCRKNDCVYCGLGLNTPPTKETVEVG